jgi:hypothetical protein
MEIRLWNKVATDFFSVFSVPLCFQNPRRIDALPRFGILSPAHDAEQRRFAGPLSFRKFDWI